MSTITSESNPTLHARLERNLAAETEAWETPAYVMNGGAQYRVITKSDGSREYALVSSETMHDSTSGLPGRP